MLLTATPHNGKRDSFASLMRMLDPTVLPAGADYTRDDVAHLFVRRFKKDVKAQMRQDFPEREVHRLQSPASATERCIQNAQAHPRGTSPLGKAVGFGLMLLARGALRISRSLDTTPPESNPHGDQ